MSGANGHVGPTAGGSAIRAHGFEDFAMRYFAGLRTQIEMLLAATYDLSSLPGLEDDVVSQALNVMRRFPERSQVPRHSWSRTPCAPPSGTGFSYPTSSMPVSAFCTARSGLPATSIRSSGSTSCG